MVFLIINPCGVSSRWLWKDAPSLLGLPSTVDLWSQTAPVRLSLKETLTSPSPCVLLHQLSPSSTCILIAGGFSRPIKTAREWKKPHSTGLERGKLSVIAVLLDFPAHVNGALFIADMTFHSHMAILTQFLKFIQAVQRTFYREHHTSYVGESSKSQESPSSCSNGIFFVD